MDVDEAWRDDAVAAVDGLSGLELGEVPYGVDAPVTDRHVGAIGR